MKNHVISALIVVFFAFLAVGSTDTSTDSTTSTPVTTEDIKKEVERLRQKRSEAVDIADFEILEARLDEPGEYSFTNSSLFIRVRNGTTVAISRFGCDAVYQTPGRSVPWGEFDFNYEISGGIEPGEDGEWSLRMNMFSDAGKLEPKSDAILKVVVTTLWGADGEKVLAFTAADRKRLAELEEKLGD